MSKYVTHKGGIILGSDNVFFVIDRQDPIDVHDGCPPLVLPDGVKDLRDGYRAIVWFEGPEFAEINSLNCAIRSPAQQLVWGNETLRWERPYKPEGHEVMILPYEREFPVLRPFWERWLIQNVGVKYDKWDTYTRSRDHGSSSIFFKRRKDALAFVREVQKHIAPKKKLAP